MYFYIAWVKSVLVVYRWLWNNLDQIIIMRWAKAKQPWLLLQIKWMKKQFGIQK